MRELSQGQRQLVSVSRALASKPKLLLLDEPAAGLDTTESAWLADRLRAVRATGVTIVLVDHDMGFVLGLCDEIHVLDFGKEIATGTAGRDPGEQPGDRGLPRFDPHDGRAAHDATTTPGARAARACRPATTGWPSPAASTWRCARGRWSTVLGPNGAGKTTLLLTLAGFLKPLGGTVQVDGAPVRPGSARRMNAAGVVLVPDSRALFTGLTTVGEPHPRHPQGRARRRRGARPVPGPATAGQAAGRHALGRRAADARPGPGHPAAARGSCSSTR